MPEDNAVELERIIRSGLGAASAPRRVIVLGAGIAGLVAATELKAAGHTVEVLEAQTRVGGRVHTLRAPFTHGLHAEAGAMRIPKTHNLTLAYIKRFGIETMPFTMDNPQSYMRFNGYQVRRSEFESDATCLGLDGGDLELNASQAWATAVDPYLQRITNEGWDAITAEFDRYSLREFLEEVARWSETQIEIFGLATQLESLYNAAFLEILREEHGRWFTDVVTIPGGMDTLPLSFLPELAGNIRFGARVIGIHQDADGVSVQYRAGSSTFSTRGDAAIVTLPFAVLRHIEIAPLLTRRKQRAIRTLYYDQSTKIFFQTRSRFWETDDGIYGGGTATDLPIRALYYPDHGRETGRGVLLASYTWGQDAERWAALSEDERIGQALENVATIHPKILTEFEGGASKAWHHDPFAGGAFANFTPGQQTALYDAIVAPEGRIHFAGEHASLAHAWIQGAIESGLRAAVEVHSAA